jgi:predicted DNA-binding protein
MAKISQKYVGLRLPEDLYKQVALIAKQEDRSVSYIIRRIIQKAIEDR